jgi:membrane protease YdiL (CAAX protease family)
MLKSKNRLVVYSGIIVLIFGILFRVIAFYIWYYLYRYGDISCIKAMGMLNTFSDIWYLGLALVGVGIFRLIGEKKIGKVGKSKNASYLFVTGLSLVVIFLVLQFILSCLSIYTSYGNTTGPWKEISAFSSFSYMMIIIGLSLIFVSIYRKLASKGIS